MQQSFIVTNSITGVFSEAGAASRSINAACLKRNAQNHLSLFQRKSRLAILSHVGDDFYCSYPEKLTKTCSREFNNNNNNNITFFLLTTESYAVLFGPSSSSALNRSIARWSGVVPHII